MGRLLRPHECGLCTHNIAMMSALWMMDEVRISPKRTSPQKFLATGLYFSGTTLAWIAGSPF